MPAIMEAIDRMSSEERVKTMEYLWAAMTAAAEPEPPAWHGDVLAERRRRVAAGEEKLIPLEEAMRQLREEVLNRLDNRPVIVLGDLNSYYSRDNVESEFINAIAASGRASAKDVWVELMNNGTYPEHLEGFVYTEVNGYVLNGETLDKIIYINPTGGGQQLKAVSFSCDQDGYRRDGKMLGDHFPVAATFEVVGTATVVDDVLSIENKVFDDTATEIYDLYGRRMMESSKGLYIERNRNGIRKRIIK